MPLVIKTDMYKRWEASSARPPLTATTQLDNERSSTAPEAEQDDSKRQEEQLLREVLAERQPMAQWSNEQKEAMIRYTLQLQPRAVSSGSGGSASGAVRLSELMEACMSMYQSLLIAQQQSVNTNNSSHSHANN